MLALSIRQPWAWAILTAGKDIENRSWPTKVRGRVLVHAGLGMTWDEYHDFVDTCRVVQIASLSPLQAQIPRFEDLQRGGIVGSVEIADCVTECASPWFFGHYGFVLRNPQPEPFRPCRGRLGFFKPTF